MLYNNKGSCRHWFGNVAARSDRPAVVYCAFFACWIGVGSSRLLLTFYISIQSFALWNISFRNYGSLLGSSLGRASAIALVGSALAVAL